MSARIHAGTLCFLAAFLLSACASRAPVAESSRRQSPPRVVKADNTAKRAATKTCANCPTPDPDYAPTADEVPVDVASTPDAVPTAEPRSRYGNPETYDVLGKTYQVMRSTPPAFKEKGRASWYGKKFHGRRTANGEVYDMFKMTAAHKTLPLPSYIRVTNQSNGRSVVVRVNDRGPFHPGRIVDLSYAAAARIDLLHHGSAAVEIELLTAQQGASAMDTGDEGKPRYLEVGRFADSIDALALREKLTLMGYADSELLQAASPAGDGEEIILRIGPFKTFSQLEAARVKLGLKEMTAIPVSD